MNIVVKKAQFKNTIKALTGVKKIALDTETTGLYPYLGHELFSIIISTKESNYYFNFNKEDAIFLSKYCELTPKKMGGGYKKSGKQITQKLRLPIPKEYILPRAWIIDFQEIISRVEVIYFHNAKFDMHHTSIEGIVYPKEVKCYCTENGARLVRNDFPTYTLAYVSKVTGISQKSDKVKEYLKAHKLEKQFKYVYFPVITEYGCQDGRTTFDLGELIEERITQKDLEISGETDLKLRTVLNNELKLTHVLFNIEKQGMLLDRDYTQNAFEESVKKYKQAESDFGMITGLEFSDGELTLKPAFESQGLQWGLTEGGKASFADGVLEGLNHPLAQIIKDHRKYYKKAHTYFENYLNLADPNGYIHCNLRQGGTIHGRMSCANPNLQNVNKEKITEELLVRRAFIPSSGFFYGMIDYDQMEYRLMLDYAAEMGVINMILDGLDVHTATKEQMGIKDRPDMSARDIAKKINFLLLYGGGVALLTIELFKLPIEIKLLKKIWEHIWKDKLNAYEIASRCNIEDSIAIVAYEKLQEAHELRQLYFTKLPKVKRFIKDVQAAAASRGFIFNWYGRRCHFNKGQEYKAPNHLIAGGCADIVKLAMVRMDDYLDKYKSRMILQIHDENIFEIAHNEGEILTDLSNIMARVYNHQHVPLTVGIDHSYSSWAEKKEWVG